MKHAEQPGEDEVVGGVGERAGVTALVDVQGDVPVHPEQGDEQRDGGDGARQRGPAGQPGLALGPGGERGRVPSRGRSGDPFQAPAAATVRTVAPKRRDHDLRGRRASRRLRGGKYECQSGHLSPPLDTCRERCPRKTLHQTVLHEKAAYNVGVVTEKGERLTIEELAARTGMTVRNIRAHQSRGLLPAPEIRGRTGYYGTEHVTRLELINEMQADGFNLQAIKRLVDVSDGSGEEVLGFKRALMAPFEQESPEFIEQAELNERWGMTGPKLLAKARRLGLIRPLGEGRFEVPSPTLYRAGEELLALGVEPRVVLEVAEQVVRRAEAISKSFVELFLEAVWKPFVEAGRPEEEWPQVREALERLRPLASEAVLATFQRAMTQGVERAFGRELEGS